jgi:hypothetical protein
VAELCAEFVFGTVPEVMFAPQNVGAPPKCWRHSKAVFSAIVNECCGTRPRPQ